MSMISTWYEGDIFMNRKSLHLNNKGFTMIELAIVLVIIGLLVAGVLKGRELISSAKIKNLVNQTKSVESAVVTYQDKYKALPGDDKAKTLRTNFNPLATTDGDALGTISSGESKYLPEHLAGAGLITGAYDGATHMTHKLGGTVEAFTHDGVSGPTRKGNVIVLKALPYEIAQQVDADMDDGTYDKGSVQASGKYDGTVANVDVYYYASF